MNKEKLKVCFTDFWPNFKSSDNYFYHLLNQNYDVSITNDDPDILFFSVDYSNKKEHLKFKNPSTKKIFYTGENQNPDFKYCDAAFTFNPVVSEQNFRLPLWALFINWFDVPYRKDRDQSYLLDIGKLINNKKIKKPNKQFCSFLASKPEGKRMEFFEKLNSKKHVSSAGRLFNNTRQVKGRGDQKWKIKYLNKFKFHLAFENSSSPGYVTEKIIQSFYANSVPIYWGAPDIGSDFNEKSFININNYKSDQEAIDDILNIQEDSKIYNDILNQPCFKNNAIPSNVSPNNVEKFINKVLNS